MKTATLYNSLPSFFGKNPGFVAECSLLHNCSESGKWMKKYKEAGNEQDSRVKEFFKNDGVLDQVIFYDKRDTNLEIHISTQLSNTIFKLGVDSFKNIIIAYEPIKGSLCRRFICKSYAGDLERPPAEICSTLRFKSSFTCYRQGN